MYQSNKKINGGVRMLFPIALTVVETVISILLAIIIGIVVGYFIRVWHHEKSIKQTKAMAEKIVEDGKKKLKKRNEKVF